MARPGNGTAGMLETMPIKDVRKNISRLAEQLSEEPESGAVTVTRRGKPVLALMSWELYEAILETLEVVSDRDLMAATKKGLQEIREGKGIPWEEARGKLDL